MTIKPPDIHTVASQARDMQPDARQAFVKQQCQDDVTLISQVYDLMKTVARESITENAETAITDSTEAEWQPSSLIGTRLGVYELVQLLGIGGMGAVFLAQRIDAEFQQQVAIKLVHNNLLSANIAARLRAERQILASLQHPNIAMLMDGGTATDGTPYIVMEYIDGLTIDAYCDRENLSIEQRLRMFLKICSAVQCAHQSLVVHRDLKPTNILVSNEGQPKLLDFGIAKLLDTPLQQRNLNLTQHDMRMLTPAHASPEQILGDVITTSSDIYVLGVLLYELLCGCRPFTFPKQYRLIDLEHIICSVKPAAPSAMINRVDRESSGFMQDIARCRSMSVAKLKRVLQGDLDNIVLMAMRKEPVRRYSSVEQFANDIKNWLDGLPVVATRDSWGYRASKFIKRYALAISGLSIAMVALIAFTILLIVHSHNTAKQRDTIAAERNRAEQVSAFLLDLFRYSDPTKARGNELKARDLLDAGAKRIDMALDTQPALRATMLDTIGQVYGNMGLNEDAIASLEKALKTRIEVSGENNLEVADVQIHLAAIRMSQGDDTAAMPLLRRALHTQTDLLGENAIEQVTALRLLGEANVDQGDFNAADENLLHALALSDSHGEYDSLDKALTLSTLGILRATQYRAVEAEVLMRAALANMLSLLGPEHPQVIELKVNLADVLETQGKYSEAQPLFEAALSEKRQILGPEHPNTITALEDYGNFLTRKGDYAHAQQVLEDVLKLNVRLHGDQHAFVAYDKAALGILDFMRGDYKSAEQKCRAALATYALTLPADHVYVAAAQVSLGRALVHEDKLDEAIDVLRSSSRAYSNALGADNIMTYRANAALGIALVAAHRIDEARPLLIAARPYLERSEKTQQIYREFEDALAVAKR